MTTGRGGARKGAGRKKGSRSAATQEQQKTLSELAKEHSPDALKALVSVMKRGKSDAARVAAANSILDRAYGKPVQAVEHSGTDGDPIKITLAEIQSRTSKAPINSKAAERNNR